MAIDEGQRQSGAISRGNKSKKAKATHIGLGLRGFYLGKALALP